MEARHERPFRPLQADEIIRQMESGNTITYICSQEDMPALSTVWAWCEAHPDFAAAYARARLRQADVHATQAVDLADSPRLGVIIDEGERDGVPFKRVRTADMVERAKLQVSARQWLAGKLNPAAYGDRTALQMLDENGRPARSGVVIVLAGAADKALEGRDK